MINLELKRTFELPYNRPYVAVWVEDRNKSLVRTVALWYDQPHWLRELRAWYRLNSPLAAQNPDSMSSVTSATRPPGKYSIKWEGKDNGGKFVSCGNYTVCIEAVRQEGGYEILRQEIECAAAPKEIQLAGSVEIASASLNYRKVGSR